MYIRYDCVADQSVNYLQDILANKAFVSCIQKLSFVLYIIRHYLWKDAQFACLLPLCCWCRCRSGRLGAAV